MDQLYRDVLFEHSEAIIKLADPDDVLLNHLILHLRNKECLNEAQEQRIRSRTDLRGRIFYLLKFVSDEGQKAFEELCNSLEDFGTSDKKEVATSLRQSLRKKRDDIAPFPGRSSQVSPSGKLRSSHKVKIENGKQ
jgi:hypothetical protein